MDIVQILREIMVAVLTTCGLGLTVGLLIITVGLREFQDRYKLRGFGNNLFKHFF